MMLAVLIFLQLDYVRSFHMIDSGKLSVLRANNGHIRFNLVGANHSFLLLAQFECVVLLQSLIRCSDRV